MDLFHFLCYVSLCTNADLVGIPYDSLTLFVITFTLTISTSTFVTKSELRINMLQKLTRLFKVIEKRKFQKLCTVMMRSKVKRLLGMLPLIIETSGLFL